MNRRESFLVCIILIVTNIVSCNHEKEKIIITSNYYPSNSIETVILDDRLARINDNVIIFIMKMNNKYDFSTSRFNRKSRDIPVSAKGVYCEYYKDQPEALWAISESRNAGAKYLVLSTPVPADGKRRYDYTFSVIELQNACYVHICPMVYHDNLANLRLDSTAIKQIVRELLTIISKIE